MALVAESGIDLVVLVVAIVLPLILAVTPRPFAPILDLERSGILTTTILLGELGVFPRAKYDHHLHKLMHGFGFEVTEFS